VCELRPVLTMAPSPVHMEAPKTPLSDRIRADFGDLNDNKLVIDVSDAPLTPVNVDNVDVVIRQI